MGDRAVLVECADGRDAVGLVRALEADPPVGLAEVVAGARSVLVRTDRPVTAGIVEAVAARPARVASGTNVQPQVLDTVYDGVDLAAVAGAHGMSPEALVGWHTGRTWTSAFLGFAPGFAYLVPDAGALDVPRRAEPRTAVPEGSVALAGRWSAVYPRRSPGGWQLLGRTGAALWDVTREPPALLGAGTKVRFRAVRSLPTTQARPQRTPGRAADPGGPGLVVIAPGLLSLVEDLGRRHRLALGVPRSGAADRGAAIRANRLVGNDGGAAVLENLGGLVVQARGDVVVALTGASGEARVERADGDVRPVRGGRPVRLPDGASLVVGRPAAGLRTYLAVRGGFAVPTDLGSRSADVLSGLGPRPLAAGEVLPVAGWASDAVASTVGLPDVEPEPTADVVVRAVAGPRDDWFDDDAARLWSTTWRVTADSNRVGLRLDGGELTRRRTDELESEPMVPGAVQVPPAGRPVVLLVDHPTTGGYPVAAVVVDADLDLLAQVAPGGTVRFRKVGWPGRHPDAPPPVVMQR